MMQLSIAENIETIVNTFQKGRKLAEESLPLEELVTQLNKTETRYRSVAFEGASMGVALNNSMETWKLYAIKTEKHGTQVHIGLGWAIAEKQLNLASSLSEIEPEMQVKVLDGFGYWHGLFQRRATIRTQQIPEVITNEFQSGFDRGVGRAIWYICKGDIAKVQNVTNHFDPGRRPDIWKGLGVASTYVGGCSDMYLAGLRSVVGKFHDDFDKGVDAANQSISKAIA